MNSSATVLVSVEHIACTSAGNNLPVGLEGKLGRASGPQVPVTTSNATVSLTIDGFHSHWQVKTVHKANIVKVWISKGKFGKCRWGLS
jgi:hypothetical protein